MSEIQHLQALVEKPDVVEPDGLVPIIHGKFTFSAVGLIVDGIPTFDEWAEVGQVLAVMERGIAFLVGDWLRFGEATYGELAAQVIDARSWRPETVRSYTWLAGRVPIENRILDRGLGISHHMVVATLEPSAQRTWLLKAASGDDGHPWSVSRLKTALKVGQDPEPTGWYVLVSFASESDQQIGLKRLQLDGLTCKAVIKR